MRIHFNQWGFFKGWANEFDVVRVALEWRSYDKANITVVIMGIMFSGTFPAESYNDMRFKIKKWWGPCVDCGKRFGRHDYRKLHLPF